MMKQQTQKKLIYLRYILSPVAMLVMAVVAFIPSYKYAIGGELNDGLSLWKLCSNSFNTSRQVIFAVSEQDAANLLFSKTVFLMLAVFALLWLIAFAAALYSAITAITYFCSDNEEKAENSRTLFITFFPNRIVLCGVQLLSLPLLLFPYILPTIYRNIWNYTVSLALTAPDALIVGAALIVAVCVLSAICAPWERRFDADLFRKRKSFGDAREYDQDDTAEDERKSTKTTLADTARAEQNERIRKLLGNNGTDDDEK